MTDAHRVLRKAQSLRKDDISRAISEIDFLERLAQGLENVDDSKVWEMLFIITSEIDRIEGIMNQDLNKGGDDERVVFMRLIEQIRIFEEELEDRPRYLTQDDREDLKIIAHLIEEYSKAMREIVFDGHSDSKFIRSSSIQKEQSVIEGVNSDVVYAFKLLNHQLNILEREIKERIIEFAETPKGDTIEDLLEEFENQRVTLDNVYKQIEDTSKRIIRKIDE